MLYFVFNLVLIAYKGILQKDKCREVYILLKRTKFEHDNLQFMISIYSILFACQYLWIYLMSSCRKTDLRKDTFPRIFPESKCKNFCQVIPDGVRLYNLTASGTAAAQFSRIS